MTKKTKETIFQISALLILFAAVFYNFRPDIARYVMIPAVVGFGVTTFLNRYKGDNFRAKRLFNMQVFAVLIMAAATYFMFMYLSQWVMLMLVSAILILYSSIMLSKIENKENDDNKKS